MQLIPGSYKSNKPFNITGIDKNTLKSDCTNGSIIKGTLQPYLDCFALISPPGHQIYKEQRIKLLKKINISLLSQMNIYLEDDDHKPVDFNGETISFTWKPVKIWKINELKYD